MKKYFAVLILCLLVILPGCSDTSITDPVLSFDKPAFPHKGRIDICCSLIDPLSGGCNLVGSVMYYHEIILSPYIAECPYTILVYMEMNTEICDMFGMIHPAWSIIQSSVDTVIVNEEGNVILEKNYEVNDRPDILLNVKYLITTGGVGIEETSICNVNPFQASPKIKEHI